MSPSHEAPRPARIPDPRPPRPARPAHHPRRLILLSRRNQITDTSHGKHRPRPVPIYVAVLRRLRSLRPHSARRKNVQRVAARPAHVPEEYPQCRHRARNGAAHRGITAHGDSEFERDPRSPILRRVVHDCDRELLWEVFAVALRVRRRAQHGCVGLLRRRQGEGRRRGVPRRHCHDGDCEGRRLGR